MHLPMFCSVELAARIEAAEVRLTASAVACTRLRCREAWTAPVGGGLAALTEPGSPLNKVVGLGFAPLDPAAWEAVEGEHTRRRAPIQVELASLGDPAVATLLTGRGHRLVGVENVLARSLVAPPEPPRRDGVRIDAVAAAHLDRWLDVVVTGFCAPDTQGVVSHETVDRAVVEPIVRDFAGADGVSLFLAMRDGEPAGAASMRIDGAIAQLCGAATLPAHRRRGIQSALLAHRLAFAARAGCELAVVTTQPGSKSQQNVMGQGFVLLYVRNVLRREG
jgi:GNAT superfamily N-acetyltransferase